MMQDVISAIDMLLIKLERQGPGSDSVEWFLINQLKDYKRLIQHAKSKQEIADATIGLSRFCTESMNWDTELYRECTEITRLGRRLAKA